jgi:inorganic pyrophosphatase
MRTGTVSLDELPALDADGRLEVVIEVPRFSFVKRDARGAIELISPLPCPFNYGSVPRTRAPDGEGIDALVLGPRVRYGARVWVPPRACARFVDAGLSDPKWICAPRPLTPQDLVQVDAFFHIYAAAKRARNALRAGQLRSAVRQLWKAPQTRYEGIDLVAHRVVPGA